MLELPKGRGDESAHLTYCHVQSEPNEGKVDLVGLRVRIFARSELRERDKELVRVSWQKCPNTTLQHTRTSFIHFAKLSFSFLSWSLCFKACATLLLQVSCFQLRRWSRFFSIPSQLDRRSSRARSNVSRISETFRGELDAITYRVPHTQ